MARTTGLTVRTIRFYCDEGILESQRSAGGHRMFDADSAPNDCCWYGSCARSASGWSRSATCCRANCRSTRRSPPRARDSISRSSHWHGDGRHYRRSRR
ncbi:MerR family transcriptional regulator [Nocardia testacea]|uniref:MerR family transcriptional regulator n=1 Tax=Nocardia testacea TaxID=248551 RepID=UPI003570D796